MGKGGMFVLGQVWQHIVQALWVLTILLVLGTIPWMILDLNDDGWSFEKILRTVAGFFALGAVVISIYLVAMHLDHFQRPSEQKHIVRVLFMVPIYALNAWLALMWAPGAMYFDTIRKIYEAFALYSFFSYVVAALGGEEELIDALKTTGDSPAHIFPLCCLDRWDSGEDFFKGVRTGINLYVLFRVLTSLFAIILYPFDLYKVGDMDPSSSYFYFSIINNITSMWAIYCLVIFYFALDKQLNKIGALSKFICIKCVIFLSWWQSVILAIMQKGGLLPESANFSQNQISVSIQDFCICIEMLFLAIAHTWAFPYKEFSEFKPFDGEQDALLAEKPAILQTLDFRDVGKDVMDTARHPVLPEVDKEAIRELIRKSPHLASTSQEYLLNHHLNSPNHDDLVASQHLPPISEDPELEADLIYSVPHLHPGANLDPQPQIEADLPEPGPEYLDPQPKSEEPRPSLDPQPQSEATG